MAAGQVVLQVADAVLREMEDRRRQRRVGAAAGEDVDEVLERAGAARRDHRDRHGARHRRGQLAVEAAARAVAVDRRQQDLAGAAVGGLARPFDRLARGVAGAAAGVDGEPSGRRRPLGVDRDDHRLAAVADRQARDQIGIGERRGVQADFVGAGIDHRRGVVFGADAAADGERDEQLARDVARWSCASARRVSSVAVTSRITTSSMPSTL